MRAKIRTGGVTPGMVPTTAYVAEVLARCTASGIPFKATAGLHHPVRSKHALTSAPDAPSDTMHGFLNLFLAATAARSGGLAEDLVAILETRDGAEFIFEAERVRWRDRSFSQDALADVRSRFAISFGSCSFDEPIADLKSLGIL
jgi:hypothetical protein